MKEVMHMKRRIISSLPLIILGLIIGLGPQFIFPVCEAGEKVMKCFWTARVELGIGGLIVLLSLIYIAFRETGVRLGLVIAIFFSSILSILVPTVLIGVCGMATMQCRVQTLPALVVSGALTALISAIYGLILAGDLKKAGNTL